MARPRKSTHRVPVVRWTPEGEAARVRDDVTVEEPLEMRVAVPAPEGWASRSVAVTMRTPGHDFELAAGFLLTEGVVRGPRDIRELTYCRSRTEPQQYNIVEARLAGAEGVDFDRLSRNVYTSSSCGVCGKASLEAIELQGCAPLPYEGSIRLPAAVVASLPDRLRAAQRDFDRTGGLHAAGLADGRGEIWLVREDVGRHNAVDKVVGEAFLTGRVPLLGHALVVSGRASFEILQKALAAGVPMVVAVGAPSSLAVEFARRFDMTLAGFVRGGGFNLYAGEGRVAGEEQGPGTTDGAAGGAA
jgi:FdhD protein